jgi:aconitase B
MRTCIDKEFARASGLMLIRIPKLIKVEYADGKMNEGSTIRYMVNV